VDGDVLVVEGNGSLEQIGRNAIFHADGQEWVHQNHVIRVRLDRRFALPAFVSVYLNSRAGRTQMIDKARTSSGLYTLSVTKVQSLEIPVLPLDVQGRLVVRIQERARHAQALLDAAEADAKVISDLPAALLNRAFGVTGRSESPLSTAP
jgi:type I restriction enzyme S subunit